MASLKNLLVLGSARFLNVIRGTIEKSQNGAFYGTCTTAADTKDKVVTLTDATGFELRPGTIVAVKWSYTNSYSSSTANPITLNVNNTGAKNIYYNTTHSGAGNTGTNTTIYGFANRINYYIYDGSYWCWMNFDLVDGNTYDRTYCTTGVYKAASAAIVAGNIIVADSNGLYHHLKTGAAFDVTHPIFYALTANNANANLTNPYIEGPFSLTTTQSITLTIGKPVFIKGQLSGTFFTPISTTPLTQTLPTSADSYEYIRLGYAYSTNAMYLEQVHPIFAYRNGKLREVVDESNNSLLLTTAVSTTEITKSIASLNNYSLFLIEYYAGSNLNVFLNSVLVSLAALKSQNGLVIRNVSIGENRSEADAVYINYTSGTSFTLSTTEGVDNRFIRITGLL